MSKEMKIITLGDIFENIETEEKAFKFKDYIKNLQQKVEQLEKENEATLKNYGNLVKEWKQLENIRKEAIEYIENNQTPISEPTTTLMKLYGRCLFERHCDDLLNILNKGGEE